MKGQGRKEILDIIRQVMHVKILAGAKLAIFQPYNIQCNMYYFLMN
jgi:hypothetical protein